MGTLEGVVRQSTENPLEKFKLTMLESGKEIAGYSVMHSGEFVQIETEEGNIPVYCFKMTDGLQALLTKYQEVWDV